MNRQELIEKAPVVAAPIKRQVFVCTGKSCSANNSEAVLETFWAILAEHGLLYGKRGSWEGSVVVTTCGSVGLCQVGPAVLVYPDGAWYAGVTPDDVREIIESHLIANQPVARLMACTIPNS